VEADANVSKSKRREQSKNIRDDLRCPTARNIQARGGSADFQEEVFIVAISVAGSLAFFFVPSRAFRGLLLTGAYWQPRLRQRVKRIDLSMAKKRGPANTG